MLPTHHGATSMSGVFRAGCLASLSLLAACGPMVGGSDGDGAVDVDADPVEAGDQGAVSDAERCDAAHSREVPYIASEYRRVFVPAGTRYLNDHTVVRDDLGAYHVFGITHESQGMPQQEVAFLHATAPSLDGTWNTLPDALTATPPETVLWAPYVFRNDRNEWTMYYYGGTPDQRVQRADSRDLSTWRRVSQSAPGGRDPFVLRDGANWLLYTVGVSDTAHGQILVSASTDLAAWSAQTVVIEDPVPSFGWGNLESPFVVRRDGWYYLFLTQTSESMIDYTRTLVFASHDPRVFSWSPITVLFSHAAEVLEFDGRWFITSAGWTGYVGERWRGLSLATLEWSPQCLSR